MKSNNNGMFEEALGYGFVPAQSQHHFVVFIPKSKTKDISIFELPIFDEELTEDGLYANFIGPEGTGKIMLQASKWEKIKTFARVEFNQRLKLMGLPAYNWAQGMNHLHRLFGKELMVLAWAVEDADPGSIPQAVENWLGLKPEERWWLYTMTNAATGHPTLGKGRGWRKALRYALTENPIPEGRYTQNLLDEVQKSLFEEDQEFYQPKKKNHNE